MNCRTPRSLDASAGDIQSAERKASIMDETFSHSFSLGLNETTPSLNARVTSWRSPK
jgi:hypothetical protein